MSLNWFANIIVHHPFVVLSTVAIFSGTCIIIPFTLKSMTFPSFQDPQLGFSTRGTSISDRLTAWTNLLKALSPSGELSENPNDYLTFRKMKKNQARRLKHFSTPKPQFKPRKSYKPNEPVYGRITFHGERNSTKIVREVNKWQILRSWKRPPKADSVEKFFCGKPDESYAHLVVTADNNADLFTIGNMLAMCRLEQKFIGLKYYEDLCIQTSTAQEQKCCKPWSMPNYIAVLNKRPSCLTITEEDVVGTKDILIKCSPYFHSMELNRDCLERGPLCDVPFECLRYDAIFNIFQYMTSTSFLPPNSSSGGTELTEAMIFLPMACSVAMLPYYHELEKINPEYDGVKVTAIDFGIKSALFDEYLLRDTWLMGTGAVFIFVCMWLYTQSLFLTLMTILVIGFSLAISYFLYFLIFDIQFFPFMNLLATIVAIGIGSDDAFIFCKIWHLQRCNPDGNLSQNMANTFNHAFVSMFVTAVTTSVAFLGSYISSVTAISCFSVFAGTAVVINYILMITWFPACVVLWERSCLSKEDVFRSFVMMCFQRWCCFKPQWNISSTWFEFPNLRRLWQAKEEFLINTIIRLKYFWCTSLSGLAFVSFIIVFIYPKLQLPDTAEFQLFSSSHPFEQYDFTYQNRFWFHAPERGTDEIDYKLPMRFVWGILPTDNGDYLDPSNLGTLTMDDTFDVSEPESQEWLKGFCGKLREQPFYHPTMGPLLPNCFIETFAKSMARKCFDKMRLKDLTPCCETSLFPFNRTVFDECILDEMAEVQGTPSEFMNSEVAGPKFSKDLYPTVKAIIVEYDSVYSFTLSFEQMHEFYTKVESWMEGEMKQAPAPMKNGFFISDLDFYDLQRELSESTQMSVIISMVLALVVLFLSTLNILTSLYAIFTISGSICVTIAVLVMLDWRLNILESVAISTAIGLTIDFSLHFAVNYKMCPPEIAVNRERATRYALSYMAGPSLMAAITTAAAGAFMMPSLILPYIKLGSFLVLVMCVSWFYSTFLLGSLLAIGGPTKRFGQYKYSNLFAFLKKKRDRERRRPRVTALRCQEHGCNKRDRPTPRPQRRSMSSGGARYTPSKYVVTDNQSPSATSAITIIMPEEN